MIKKLRLMWILSKAGFKSISKYKPEEAHGVYIHPIDK